MTHELQEKIKPFLQKQIITEIKKQKLTSEKAAEILRISTRSYSHLKSGENMCSASTLVMFLVKLCESPERFVEDCREHIDKIDETA